MSKYDVIFNEVKGIFECSRGDVLDVIERDVHINHTTHTIGPVTEKLVFRCTKGDVIDLLLSKYLSILFGGNNDQKSVIFTDIPKVIKTDPGYVVSYSVYSNSIMMTGDFYVSDLPSDIRDMKLGKIGINE